jgi:hypothetical protein
MPPRENSNAVIIIIITEHRLLTEKWNPVRTNAHKTSVFNTVGRCPDAWSPHTAGSTMSLSILLLELYLYSSIHLYGMVRNTTQFFRKIRLHSSVYIHGVMHNAAKGFRKLCHWWSYTSTPPYTFTMWCLMQHSLSETSSQFTSIQCRRLNIRGATPPLLCTPHKMTVPSTQLCLLRLKMAIVSASQGHHQVISNLNK